MSAPDLSPAALAQRLADAYYGETWPADGDVRHADWILVAEEALRVLAPAALRQQLAAAEREREEWREAAGDWKRAHDALRALVKDTITYLAEVHDVRPSVACEGCALLARLRAAAGTEELRHG